MLPRALLVAASIILATPAAASTSPHVSYPNWNRGIHVFGSVLFDFGLQRVAAGYFVSELSDCSNERFYCLSASFAKLAVPKICEDVEVGSTWSTRGVTTRVVAKADAPQGHLTVPGQQWYYLMSDENPEMVFVYMQRNGVQAILFDPNRRAGFDRIAQRGELSDFADQSRRAGSAVSPYWNSLITRDVFAGCTGSQTLP